MAVGCVSNASMGLIFLDSDSCFARVEAFAISVMIKQVRIRSIESANSRYVRVCVHVAPAFTEETTDREHIAHREALRHEGLRCRESAI